MNTKIKSHSYFKTKDEELLFYRKVLKSINASVYIEGVDPYSVEWVADNETPIRVLGLTSEEVMARGDFASALIDNEQDFYEAITLSTQALIKDSNTRWTAVCRMRHTKGHSNWILFSTANFENTSDAGGAHKSITVAISLKELFKSKSTLVACIEDLKKSVYEEEHSSLTNRQHQVLQLIGKGLTTPEMAVKLKISKHTITDHRKAIYKKLHCKNERELLITASKYGMI